jgi:hypothetical protein
VPNPDWPASLSRHRECEIFLPLEPRWHRPTFPTRRHERVHGLLSRLVSEGTAHFFADACDISQRQPPYRTTSHIAGHLIREVESALRQVLFSLPAVKLRFSEYPGNAKERHLAEVDAISHVFDLEKNDVAAKWRAYAVKGKGGWSRDAHRADLQLPREPKEEFALRLDGFVDLLAVVLDAAEANYAAVIRALSEACAKPTPSSDDLSFVATHLAPGVAAISHIFAGLTPAWLVPLRERGVFDEPPDVLFHEGGSYSFPEWPQATYLLRIAPESPEEVAKTIEGIPICDNENIHWAFLRTAFRLPAPEARRVAHREIPWLSSRDWRQGPLPNAVQELVLHLAEGDELDCAFDLLLCAMTLVRGEDESVAWRGRRARMSEWDFERLVRCTVGALAARNPARTKAFLFGCLDEGQKDESSHWRHAVEDHAQNVGSEPLDHMFVELRKIWEAEVERGGEHILRAAVEDLESRPGKIYSRLALHLLRRFGKTTPDLVVERATNQTLLDSAEAFHELASMIADRFPELSRDQQNKVIAALRENSSSEHVRAEHGDTVPSETLDWHAQLKRRQWFAILGSHLPPDVRAEYGVLCAGRGEPEHPTFNSWYGARTGPNAPIAMPELLAMDDEKLLQYLCDWVPATNDHFEPSRTGLGHELNKCVVQEPKRFSHLARRFRGHHPQYVGNLLWGLQEVSRRREASSPPADDAIDWDSMLDLAEWTSEQQTLGIESYDVDNPQAWTWARQQAVDVAENAAIAAACGPGQRLQKAWQVVRKLLRDEDPSSERVADNKMDDDTFSINTVRGQAIHAALVVAGTLAESKASPEVLGEVLREIEARSDENVEPCRAIRGVLARRFSLLFVVDKERAGRVARSIFPLESEPDATRDVMWQTFLSWNGAAGELFLMLQAHYSATVRRLSEIDEKTTRKLAEHLIWLAAWGVSGASPPDGLVAEFVRNASMPIRHHALETIGRAIHHEEAPLPAPDSQRLKGLWSWWSEQRAGADLAAFGWWISSPAFDGPWRLSTLPRVLEVTGGALDWDESVCETLAVLVEQWPQEVAHCLGILVDSDAGHRIHRCSMSIRKILEALRSGATNETARKIAARLVARKYPNFSDLM